ncbi:hypothetical protein IFM89_029130 [Coptis chinensis]|uniref:Plastocyanin-like domain-containing protein n=1 Tax=Coptis chinensis TaxID=261450 RepID=A0A835M7A8_9MAGN|nr:hypothetical protein IFM89_029130 [Coptis chinensis]
MIGFSAYAMLIVATEIRGPLGYPQGFAKLLLQLQVFAGAWTAILVSLDNVGMWNLRAQNLNVWYLGQEVYVSVVNPEISNKTELPLPDNAIYCGLLTYLQKTQAHKVSFSGAETVCRAQVESQVEVVCGGTVVGASHLVVEKLHAVTMVYLLGDSFLMSGSYTNSDALEALPLMRIGYVCAAKTSFTVEGFSIIGNETILWHGVIDLQTDGTIALNMGRWVRICMNCPHMVGGGLGTRLEEWEGGAIIILCFLIFRKRCGMASFESLGVH